MTAGLEGLQGGRHRLRRAGWRRSFLYRASRAVRAGRLGDGGLLGTLAAVTLGQENSAFVSNVVLYELDQEEPYADYDVTDGLVAALGEQDGSGS